MIKTGNRCSAVRYGFVLAAGFGTRLRPLTDLLPKPLLPIANIPSICYAIALLREAGIHHIAVNIHHKADMMEKFLSADPVFRELRIFRETEIAGTGGGLKQAQSFFGDHPFVLINSDIITTESLDRIIDAFQRNRLPAMLVLRRSDKARQRGSVVIEQDRIIDLANRRGSNRVSELHYTGIAVFSSVIFDYLHPGYSDIVSHGFVDLIEQGRMGYLITETHWCDIGSIYSYWQANIPENAIHRDLARRLDAWLPNQMRRFYQRSFPPSSFWRERYPECVLDPDSVDIRAAVRARRCVILPETRITRPGDYQDGILYGPDGDFISARPDSITG